MTTTAELAGFLGALRLKNRAVPINAAEALLLVASGVDTMTELQQAMRDSDGQPLPAATTSRLISLLRGRARYSQGKWLESPYALLEVRPHPHRRGLQLRLSQEGRDLINAHLGTQLRQYTCTKALADDMSTCDEQVR